MKSQSGDSLSGKNSGCGVPTGAGSSPAIPTKTTRHKLWKRLQKLDRRISRIEKQWDYIAGLRGLPEKRQRFDLLRKQIRRQLKGYGI